MAGRFTRRNGLWKRQPSANHQHKRCRIDSPSNMPSNELKALLAMRRANRPDPASHVERIRSQDKTDPGRIPCPGATFDGLDADGVYCEWVEWETPTMESVFLYLHGGGYYRSSGPASRMAASNLSKACVVADVSQWTIGWLPSTRFLPPSMMPTPPINGFCNRVFRQNRS